MIESHFTHEHLDHTDMLAENDSHEDHWPDIQRNPFTEVPRLFKRNCDVLLPIAALIEPNENRTWGCLLRAQSLGMGIFESNERSGNAFPFRIIDDHVMVVGRRDYVNTNYQTWLTTFYLSILARSFEWEGIEYLKSIDISILENAELGASLTPFNFALVELLKTVFTSGSDLAGALEKALVASNPNDYPNDEEYLYASRIEWPIPSILMAIFSENGAQEYNEEMQKALLLHKEYYSSHARKGNRRGAISIPLTAMAVLAKKLYGYQLATETNYIPSWLNKYTASIK